MSNALMQYVPPISDISLKKASQSGTISGGNGTYVSILATCLPFIASYQNLVSAVLKLTNYSASFTDTTLGFLCIGMETYATSSYKNYILMLNGNGTVSYDIGNFFASKSPIVIPLTNLYAMGNRCTWSFNYTLYWYYY